MNYTVYKQHPPFKLKSDPPEALHRADVRSVGQVRGAKSLAHAFSMARKFTDAPILEEIPE